MNYSEKSSIVPSTRPKKALITGVSGQDGSYLAEFLSAKGYNVYGVDKSFSQLPHETKNAISQLHEIDLTKPVVLKKIILNILPDEIYHLAAYHFSSQLDGNSKMSFVPFNAINLVALNVILETIRDNLKSCRTFYASSSHIFGKVDQYPQSEYTPYHPESLYAITKAAGNELCRFYREYYDVYTSVGILYNHESPRRSLSFITAQIAEAAAMAKLGLPVKLTVRDLDGIVDWGAAQDYIRAMWLSLQQPHGDTYIISTGVPVQVRDFAQIAFNHVGLDSNNFIFQDKSTARKESIPYIGDSSKLRNECKWSPEISFYALVVEMVEAHVRRLKKQKINLTQ